jgi:hypothetical protein
VRPTALHPRMSSLSMSSQDRHVALSLFVQLYRHVTSVNLDRCPSSRESCDVLRVKLGAVAQLLDEPRLSEERHRPPLVLAFLQH